MLRIISINVNGIRASAKKGLFHWLAKQKADVICLQEVRACPSIVAKEDFQLPGYHCYYEAATIKKGYSGVGIFSKQEPDKIIDKLGFELSDVEGRYIQLEFPNVNVASLYLPSGTSGDERQDQKYAFMDFYGQWLKKHKKSKKPWIICGDWNIAHKKIDIKNWRSNQKNSGFLPEERAWLDWLFDEVGYVDAFRAVNQDADEYTWWSNRGQAWANNTGWRIDYQVISPSLKGTVRRAEVYKQERFSDHAPLIIDYDMDVQ